MILISFSVGYPMALVEEIGLASHFARPQYAFHYVPTLKYMYQWRGSPGALVAPYARVAVVSLDTIEGSASIFIDIHRILSLPG
jgi:hypothetical protein